MKKKDGILKRIPLRMRVLMGLITLSGSIALFQKPPSFKKEAFWSSLPSMIETGLSIFIFLVLIALLAFIIAALIVSATGGSKKKSATVDKKSDDHHPAPAAAPAAAGHGHEGGHEDHGHGHKEPLASQIIAVAVVLGVFALIGVGIKSCGDSRPKAIYTSNPKTAQAPTTVGTLPQKEDSCSAPAPTDPESVKEIEVPVDGVSERIEAPDGYRNCYGPYRVAIKLRFKSGDGLEPPDEWSNEPSRYKWLGIKPGESSEPITVKRWIVPMD